MDTNLHGNLNSNLDLDSNSGSDPNSKSYSFSSSDSSSDSNSDSNSHSNSNSNSSSHSEWNAQKAKTENVPKKRELDAVEDSYLNILNKKKVLYKYVFRYNNRKYKFQLLSTYYEYLMLCKNLINDVTTCNLFFHKKIFSEVIQKPLYYPYILYIYDENDSHENGTKVIEKENKEVQKYENCLNLDFIKMSILDIDEIIEKGKKKEKTYFDGKNNMHTSKIMKCMSEINKELQMYNLKQKKKIVGYVELYLLFHMSRFFDSRIERLVIHKLFRNQKLGFLIMNISIFLLKHLYHSNRCDLTAENEIAIYLYKKLRFHQVETNTFRLYLHSNYNYFFLFENFDCDYLLMKFVPLDNMNQFTDIEMKFRNETQLNQTKTNCDSNKHNARDCFLIMGNIEAYIPVCVYLCSVCAAVCIFVYSRKDRFCFVNVKYVF